MPPKKKKQPRNSYYYFMLDLKDELQRTERQTYSMADIAEIAAPKWRVLIPREREHYEEMARQAKSIQGGGEGKRDTFGNLIEENLRQEEEVRSNEKKMHNHIDQIISEDLGHKRAIAGESFFFMSASFFCITEEGVYVPAEIAMVHYSIENGIINHFHCFINPGPIPTGYTFACKSKSENELHIPYSNFEKAKKDYNGIIRGIEDLLAADGLQDGYPIVYCMPEEIAHIKKILEWLQKDGRTRKIIRLTLYDVTMLLSATLRFAEQQMSPLIAYDCLNTSIFTYQPNTCCEYHWEEDYPQSCVLGNVKRIGFVFSDLLCALYDVKLVPGKHLPKNPESSHYAVYPPNAQQHFSSAASVCSTSSKSTVWSEMKTPLKPKPISPVPRQTFHDDTTSSIMKAKSKYDTSSEPHFEPSVAPSAWHQAGTADLVASFSRQASVSDDWTGGASGGLQPLRQPKQPSFAEKMHRPRPVNPVTDIDSFPSLDANSRSSSAMSGFTSDVSLGLPSDASVSSYTTNNVYSSMSGSTFPESATPIGRGIGRGRGYMRVEEKKPGLPRAAREKY